MDESKKSLSLKLTEAEYDEMIEARSMLFRAINENETGYEQKITLVGSGAITLSMAFVVSITPYYMGVFCVAITLLVTALVLNLSLYLLTSRWFRGEYSALDLAIDKKQYRNTRKTIPEINRKINRYNWINLAILIIGVLLMLIFVLINI